MHVDLYCYSSGYSSQVFHSSSWKD